MRRTTLLSLASLLLLGSSIATAADAGGLGMEELTQNDSATKRIPSQQRMFDGVKLTEQQRQQMRDLMQEVRHDMKSRPLGGGISFGCHPQAQGDRLT